MTLDETFAGSSLSIHVRSKSDMVKVAGKTWAAKRGVLKKASCAPATLHSRMAEWISHGACQIDLLYLFRAVSLSK